MLSSIGLSVSGFATLNTIFNVITSLIWYGVGFFLFWRRSDDWLALLAAFVLVMFNVTTNSNNNVPSALALAYPALSLPLSFMNFLGSISLGVFFLLFPGGRLVPRWMRLILLLFIINAFGEFLATFIIWPAALLLIPLSIGFSILRYRLYDIDVLINRTLVYGTLTVLQALIYVGLVIGLGSLVRLFTGQLGQSPVVIVVSTLAIAALFQPLRHRIQAIIDHRFYRRKYDAARTLAAFSAALRNEVDLSQLSEHLLNVVEQAMQPAHVSLWLRPPEQTAKHQAESTSNPSGAMRSRRKPEGPFHGIVWEDDAL